MDALKKLLIIWFTPYPTTTLPKWMFAQKLLFKSCLLLNGYCGIQVQYTVCPPNNSNDLCLLFIFVLLLWHVLYIVHSTLPLYCAVDTTLCCVKQNKASIVFPASTRHFYCFNATFLLRQRDISTASTRHFYCIIATFLLRQCDISTASAWLFYCVNAIFLLHQRNISTASTWHLQR